ncbi:MAG: InlB B-repeat-containing protein, partial [Oscillospiraceae bacterium]|nr:InlB B-repeat-containing protein [Oscillospiraceae bacterium]
MKTKLRVISLFIISTLILSFLPATTVLADDPPEDITDYYNENVPTLNTWQDAPRDYVMTHDYDVSDHENNIFPNLGHVLANRFIFPGDTITETIDSQFIYYILLTGIGEEKYVGITERYATGSGGTNTYTFGVTDVNNCYRKLTFDKLTGQALKAGSGGGQGPTNEGELGDDPYPRGGWASVYPVSITRNITYELHGGIIQYGENPTSVNISNENHDLYVYKPIQEGKHYSYWGRGDFQDNGDGTLKMTLPALRDGDIGPLYAVYVPGNTVKFVAGEGATIHCLSTLIVEAGETFDVRDYVPRRAGYRFDGWYENEDFSGSPVTTVTHFDEYKSVLYAKWVDASPKVSYQTHVQDVGWQGYVSNGASSGTSGESKRLEAIKIKLENLVGGIEYRTHVQDIGWQNYVSNGDISGTSGQSKRLEGIQIKLENVVGGIEYST